ncbi:MAG: PLP-dependent aminotransferase family protein [Chloroflexi bacterium]|nr:PLP-dependent aminotransferase family protein [Chloroflexota bacterium]
MTLLALHLDRTNDTPLYLQIYDQLKMAILAGEIGSGTRLPSSRQLAQAHGVGRITVTQAYQQLEMEGYVYGRTGAGTYVSDDLPVAEKGAENAPFVPALSAWGERVMAVGKDGRTTPSSRPEIDFGFGRSFPHIFPYDIWRRLLARYLSTDDVMLSRYGSVAGFYPLRQALADYLRRLRGVRCTADQVVIVSGVQQALDILARLLLMEGDGVLVETPGYVDAFALFRLHGCRLLALPVGDCGFPVAQIPADCKARLAYVTPSNQFPRGGAMPLPAQLALLQWARQHEALIVEDDYDGELRYEGRPLAAMQGLDTDGRVVYLGTFSKVLFPALRLSYVVLPESLVTAFVRAKGLVDRGAPTLTQAAVADFITEGHFERHLKHLRQAYGRRRQVLIKALEKYLPGKVQYVAAPAGLHVMLYLPPEVDEAQLVRDAAQAGVGVYPGRPYHVQADAPPSILLGFSGLAEPEIEEGIRLLAAVMETTD